ncbi:MAG: type 3 dihydrofolate reductase [Pseudomonadota bacterium]
MTQTISLIAAMSHQRIIGKDNQMPWHLPADLQHFKRVTLGKPVLMGRKTYESIGKALPGRKNIVITRDVSYQLDDAMVVHSVEDALAIVQQIEEVMIIGGAQIYQQTLHLAQKLYLTFIDCELEGDAVFPQWNEQVWSELSRTQHQKDEKNPFNYTFVELLRKT